jgi:catechol 2,3-dioxygenase-like lactoylglutathione lyase family enzyme
VPGQVLRLHHVALPFPGSVDDMAVARHFYGAVLGLRELAVPPSLPGVLWFAAGDQEIHLFSEPLGAALNARSRRHPCLEVDDLLGLLVHLAENGIQTIDAEGDIPARIRFFALDPFGNALEFVEFDVNAS